ncbi:rhomboid family domain protein [Mycobacterium kansasii 824]|nr:rhomboid family domain protein [Mycobacterium kansasii 824]
MRWVVAVIVINLVFTFVVPAVSSQLISWQGHVGGLVTGGWSRRPTSTRRGNAGTRSKSLRRSLS